MNVRIGTRPSRLALRQVEEIKKRLRRIQLDIIPIETKGDKDKNTPLTGGVQDDFFTYEIEKALLEDRIDAAVHSAKDLEKNMPRELFIAAKTRSISPFECLISKGSLSLDELPKGSIVGTSSLKRREAIRNLHKGFIVKPIRGNVDERIKQLDRGEFDAIIVAHAALIRLGLEKRVSEVISQDIIKPHPLQGRLAIQVKRARRDMIKLFRSINEK